jgi:hypothetical protein
MTCTFRNATCGCTTNETIFPQVTINPVNTKLNPICHMLVFLGAHPILHVSRIRVNWKCCILRMCDISVLLSLKQQLTFVLRFAKIKVKVKQFHYRP